MKVRAFELLLALIGSSIAAAQSSAVVSGDEEASTVLVITTGGTIASRTDDSVLSADELIKAVPGLDTLARVQVEEFSNVGSSAITPEDWRRLSQRVSRALREDGKLSGVVVTHGTDTLEETAYFLDLTIRDRRPIVVVGAMRSANELSADGSANLYNAVRVAVADSSRGQGVLVVLNEEIHTARDVSKSHNRGVHTFTSRNGGPLGIVDPTGVRFYRKSLRRHTYKSDFDVDIIGTLAKVPIVNDYPGFDPALLDVVVELGGDGLVFTGFGGGRMSPGAREAIARASASGLPIVISSRVPFGRLDGDPLDGIDATVARDISPGKARILLMLSLSHASPYTDWTELFREYGDR